MHYYITKNRCASAHRNQPQRRCGQDIPRLAGCGSIQRQGQALFVRVQGVSCSVQLAQKLRKLGLLRVQTPEFRAESDGVEFQPPEIHYPYIWAIDSPTCICYNTRNRLRNRFRN